MTCCAETPSHDHGSCEVKPGDPPHVHHMDSKTAYDSAKLGMWLFLATEILLFSVLIVAFILFRHMHLEQFHHASKSLNWRMGLTNTIVLLFSSLLAALAVDAARLGNNKRVFNLLMGAIGCGGIFVIVKYFEYSKKYAHGLFPGGSEWFTPESMEHYNIFFGLYYCMTGLHAFHVIVGMGVLGWAACKARKNRYSGRYFTPVEIGALYWHLVDLIWIYLFPLLYLVG